MNFWNIPLSSFPLTLAADARFAHIDYTNDHIWELKVSDGVPPSLGISTSFGLRARKFILFPQFSEENITLTAADAFFEPPMIDFAYANFASVSFSPFEGLDVVIQYWIPESHAVWGKVRITNTSALLRRVQFAWVALLSPNEPTSEDATRMAAKQLLHTKVLCGKTVSLVPLVCMRGDIEIKNVPYPSLVQHVDVEPGYFREWLWAEAACENEQDSFSLARSYLNKNWDAELARLHLANLSLIQIECGEPSWSQVFNLSQQIALSLFSSNHNQQAYSQQVSSLPYPSLLLTRNSYEGYSIRGDGTDYAYAWCGQSVMDVYYATWLLLPAAADLFEGLIKNYFSVQKFPSGFIDFRPGLAGQRSYLLATPMLVNLTWKVYQVTHSQNFLRQSLEPLLAYIQCWFDEHDIDIDGALEWDSPSQFLYDEHWVFSRHVEGGQGSKISFVESPALCALMLQELLSLQNICKEINIQEPSLRGRGYVTNVSVSELIEMLTWILNSFWSEEEGLFIMRDRDTHLNERIQNIGWHQGNGSWDINLSFNQPLRFVLRLETFNERSQRPEVTLIGKNQQGRMIIEQIPLYYWEWGMRRIGFATTKNTFYALEKINIDNINAQDIISLSSVYYHLFDLSLFFPLNLAHLPSERANSLLYKLLDEQEGFYYPFGLGEYAKKNTAEKKVWLPSLNQTSQDKIYPETPISRVKISLPYQTMLCEGLLVHGKREKAAEVFMRMMKAIIQTVEKKGAFFECYDALTGEGFGNINSLRGLAPLGMFLKILGVTLYSSWKVGLEGENPFPWQVTIHYRGLTIIRDKTQTYITFPDEQTMVIDSPSACIVEVEEKIIGDQEEL